MKHKLVSILLLVAGLIAQLGAIFCGLTIYDKWLRSILFALLFSIGIVLIILYVQSVEHYLIEIIDEEIKRERTDIDEINRRYGELNARIEKLEKNKNE